MPTDAKPLEVRGWAVKIVNDEARHCWYSSIHLNLPAAHEAAKTARLIADGPFVVPVLITEIVEPNDADKL